MDLSGRLLLVSAFLAVLCIPLVAGLVPPNRFYGFRTPATLSNPTLWYRANRFAGLAVMSACAIAAALLAIAPAVPAPLALGGPILLAVFASIAYTRRTT